MNSARIPTRWPCFLQDEEIKSITEWMKTRPYSEMWDDSVNRSARWIYTYQDHGMWLAISVKDTDGPSEGSTFEVPSDPDNW